MTTTPDTENRWVEYMPLEQVKGADRNPRRHNIPELRASVARFGLGDLPMVDERTGQLVAGHGRIQTLRDLRDTGGEPPRFVRVGPDGVWLVPVQRGWASTDDLEAAGYLMADNRQTELAGWDMDGLIELLGEQDDYDGLGWSVDEIEAMLDGPEPGSLEDGAAGAGGDDEGDADDEDTDDAKPAKGSLLAVAGVTVGEPDYETSTGQVWQLGRHHLAVVEVVTGAVRWKPLLSDEHLFVPYPSLLVPFADAAKDWPLLMVQPNTYLAGWLLTKWKRITGTEPVLVKEI